MIVIIPEGIEAATSPGEASHIHKIRSLARRGSWAHGVSSRETLAMVSTIRVPERRGLTELCDDSKDGVKATIERVSRSMVSRQDDEPAQDETPLDEHDEEDEQNHDHDHDEEEEEEVEVPKFEIGFSLVVGFILMFLIDRLPRHAADSLQPPPGPQHFSLDNLGGNGAVPSSSDEEADGFLGSFTPTPRKARSLATTIGLVIHAAADGIAMGASATSSNMKLGFIIFIAIMIHKAPAAFGLTAVLLRQGLSKRTARVHLIAFSLAAPIGAISTWLFMSVLGGGGVAGDSWWTGMLLLFSGGTFL
jgi:zinc transporter 9